MLARSIAERADVAYYENIPVGVERTVREKDGRQWVFYFNNTEKRQSVKNEETRRLAAGKAAASDGALTLEPFEMKILQAEAEGRKVI